MVLQDIVLTLSVSAIVTGSLSVGLILVLVLCVPCLRKKRGFSNFQNSNTSLDNDQGEVNNSFTLTIDDNNSNVNHSTFVTFEPLPDITSRQKHSSIPLRPQITCVGKARQDESLKLTVHHPFPRNQIVYLKELGNGWFGKVIESDAEKIAVGVPRSKVVVKMLKDDASQEEKHHFFEEVVPFRLLEHSNIMRVLGQCTETTPVLMILEAAAYGNLKHYLCSHRHNEALLIQKNRLMQFAVDVSCGLSCLHRHDYLHRDLAARNCLVMSDYTLKIGDYGIADSLFQEDYFGSGANLLPIRWMAPEILKRENGIWTSHNFSKDSDIWSLGVVLWEIATMGEQPYGELSDEEVLRKVVMDREVQLQEPHVQMPHKDRLYDVMRCCWLDHSQRVPVDEIHRLLQVISSVEPASSDAISSFDQKWAQLMPNQHHWSADSIDSQLASASRGDASFISEGSLPNSFDNLTTPELHQDHTFGTKAIVHASAGNETLNDTPKESKHKVAPSVLGLHVETNCISAPFCANPCTLSTDQSDASLKCNNVTLDNHQTDVFATGTDLPFNEHLFSGSENSSSGFDVLESTADFDFAEDKSVSDSVGTCQSSATGEASIDKDSSSCEFIVINDFKDTTALSSSAKPTVFNGSASAVPSEIFTPLDSSQKSVPQSFTDKTSTVNGTTGLQDTDVFMSLGTEFPSLSSLTAQISSVESDGHQSLPSFASKLSSLNSLTISSDTCDGNGPQSSENTAGVSTDMNEGSSSIKALNNVHFDTLSPLSSLDCQRSATSRKEPPVQSKGIDSGLVQACDSCDSVAEESFGNGERTECVVSGKQKIAEQSPVGLENGESVSEGSVSDSSDVVAEVRQSKEKGHIPDTITNPPVSPDLSESGQFSLTTSLSQETQDNGHAVLQHTIATSTDSPSAASSDDCVDDTGVSSTDVDSGTDTDSTTNSDSGKDYICDGSWEEQQNCQPPSGSPASSVDSEEYALQIASEIYLSKGLKMGRPFESTFLEPIPEDPLPSISEESVAPAPSDSSSVDVKFDEVFEWDDFMGEPLVGKERTSPEGGSPRESFDMSDWMLDMESDSLPNTNSSLTSQLSNSFRKDDEVSDPRSIVTAGSSYSQFSASESEQASYSQSRNHRSYISDLLSNRTKGATSTSSHSFGGHRKFYSLYEEEFDLESDSQSEGGNSPPVSRFLSDPQDVEACPSHLPSHQGTGSAVSHADIQGLQDDGHGASSSDDQDETHTPPLD